MKTERIFKKLIVFILLITLCAAGLPAQKTQAADNSGSAAASVELERPVITALKNTSQGIKVSWDIVDDADYYCVYRKTSGDSGFKKIGQTESCEYVNSPEYDLRGSKIAYKVRAVAVDSEKNKVLSPVSEVKTINFLYRPDQHMMKVSVTGTGVALRVPSMQKAAGIIIYRKGPDEAAFTRIAKISEKSGMYYTYTDTELTEGKYSYKVCYYKGSSKSAVSEVRALCTEAPSLKVRKTANTTKLSWNAAAGANRYQIYWSDTGSSYKCIADTDETAYVIKGYPEDYMYGSYKVRPYFKDTGRTYFGPFSAAQAAEK